MRNRCLEQVNFFKSFYIASKYIFDTEGLKGYWRGLSPSLLRAASGSAIYF